MILVNLPSEFLYQAYFRMQGRIRIYVLPVKIFTCSWSPAIANDHTIRIYHWNDNKPGNFPQFDSLLVLRAKPFYKSHDHVWAVRLTGMNPPSCEYNSFTGLVSRWIKLVMIGMNVSRCTFSLFFGDFCIRRICIFVVGNM